MNAPIEIVNVVVTAELKQFIDLEKLLDIGGFLYDPSVYKCAYFKDRVTQSKVSIFSTGKLISVGAKSPEKANLALGHAMSRLVTLGLVKRKKLTPKLQNIVATSKLDGEVDMERLQQSFPHVVYEPEQFPGAMYYPKDLLGASVLVFSNGKIVFAGLKTTQSLETARTVLQELAKIVTSHVPTVNTKKNGRDVPKS